MRKKVILFFDNFDPFTNNHLHIANTALKEVNGDVLKLSPNKNYPAKRLSPFKDRLNMVELGFKPSKQIKLGDFHLDFKDKSGFIRYLSDICNNSELYVLINLSTLEIIYQDLENLEINFLVYLSDDQYFNPISYPGVKVISKINCLEKDIQMGDYTHLSKKVKDYIITTGLYLKKQIRPYMSPKRYKHTLSVLKTALPMAKNSKVSKNDIRVACLLHDIAKEYDKVRTSQIMEKYYPEHLCESERIHHQYVGEYIAKKRFKITNGDILKSIKYHTSATSDMSPLAKILYSSDKIEPLRDFDSTFFIKECIKDIEKGFMLVLEDNLKYIIRRNVNNVNEDTRLAMEQYLKGEDIYEQIIEKYCQNN